MTKEPRGLCLLSAVFTLTASSCGLLMMRPPVDISGYRGDGTIDHIKNPVNPGFKVDFEFFSLARPYTARYTLDGVPKPRWHDVYQAGLLVELVQDEEKDWPKMPVWLTTGASGKLVIRLQGWNGSILFQGEAQVSKMYWSRFIDDLPFGMMWFDPLNTHEPTPWTFPSDSVDDGSRQPWTLDVDYIPGADSHDRTARIRFMAGGRE